MVNENFQKNHSKIKLHGNTLKTCAALCAVHFYIHKVA